MSDARIDRPPPDPARLLAAIEEWSAGEQTAGTTMQTLKRVGLDELVPSAGNEALQQAWDDWERGRVAPTETLQRMDEAGVRPFLSGLIGS